MFSAAAAISLGTYSGGWRIMRTLGRRIIHLDPARGFSAETAGTIVLYTTAFVFEAPISTTHTITSAIMGAGATKRFSAVRWGVARSIVTAWILTFPMAGSAAALIYLALPVRLPAALSAAVAAVVRHLWLVRRANDQPKVTDYPDLRPPIGSGRTRSRSAGDNARRRATVWVWIHHGGGTAVQLRADSASNRARPRASCIRLTREGRFERWGPRIVSVSRPVAPERLITSGVTDASAQLRVTLTVVVDGQSGLDIEQVRRRDEASLEIEQRCVAQEAGELSVDGPDVHDLELLG